LVAFQISSVIYMVLKMQCSTANVTKLWNIGFLTGLHEATASVANFATLLESLTYPDEWLSNCILLSCGNIEDFINLVHKFSTFTYA